MQKDFITATPDSGTTNATVTVAASANQTESARSTTLSITGGGITRTVTNNQAAGVTTWVYSLSVSPTSLSFVGGGEAKGFTITSTKQKRINGSNVGSPVAVTTSNGISGTGFSISGNTVTAAANQTEASRTGTVTVTQAESGRTATVSLSQAAGVVTWTYAFRIVPTSLSFTAAGGTQTVTITSTRTKLINGTATSTQENVGYTQAVAGTGYSGNGTNGITAAANTTTTVRNGTATYTQNTSGNTSTVSMTQNAGKATNWITTLGSGTSFKCQANQAVATGLSITGIISGEFGDETFDSFIRAGERESASQGKGENDGVSITNVDPSEDATFIYRWQ